MKSCNKCKFAIFQDEGYSNYTVENTTFNCAVNKHPDKRFDRFYGEDKRLDFAQKCKSFESGEPIEMDVERDRVDLLSEGQKQIYQVWAR